VRRRRKKRKELAPYQDRRARDALSALQTVAVEVENPHDLDRGKIVVLAATRDDVLRRLRHAPNDPIDEAQFVAGRRWEADWQRAQQGQVISSQFRERVDGGGASGEILTDQQRAAQRRLAESDRALGHAGAALVRDILGRGFSISASAIKYRGKATDKTERYISARFRECLETLAAVYGLKFQGSR
jgi:hypothetical protein